MAMNPSQPQDTYDVEAATRLSRLGATVVDGLAFAVPAVAMAILVPLAMVSGGVGSMMIVLVLALVILLGLLVAQIVLLVKHGQTLGKRALRIRMITSSGETPSIWRVFFLRWLPFVVVAGVIELVFKVKGLGNLIHVADALLIFQATRRCLHDLFADTHVIKA
jgi:uncharacterized RDD family membrane protein YckC